MILTLIFEDYADEHEKLELLYFVVMMTFLNNGDHLIPVSLLWCNRLRKNTNRELLNP